MANNSCRSNSMFVESCQEEPGLTFLLACYDSDGEEFQTICKTGTGFKEAELEILSASLRSKVIPRPKSYYRYSETLNPDVWEVKASELTISPVHCAALGIVDPNKGMSVRFPQFVRTREDKNPEQATSSDTVADMYNAQKHSQKDNRNDESESDDDD